MEPYSGFNSFYGVGSKLGTNDRNNRVDRLREKHSNELSGELFESVIRDLRVYLTSKASTEDSKLEKVRLRADIVRRLDEIGDEGFKDDVLKVLFRPMNELYIPLPSSSNFHSEHPDFFAPGLGNSENLKRIKDLPKESRKFTLVFEPSGDKIESYITQENGKAIESYDAQSILGEWILRKVFQLGEYEPLTMKRLEEIGINGIRLYKLKGLPEVHLQFIWIDDGNLPDDYILPRHV